MHRGDTSLADMRAGRRVARLADLAALPVARDAALEEAEVAAVVLYTGPMVRGPSRAAPSAAPSSPCDAVHAPRPLAGILERGRVRAWP